MFIAIEGVIGVGKTSLARLLQPSLNANLLLEVFEENPFLSNFYQDRKRYAFQTQMFFLLSRYHQQRRGVPGLLASDRPLISDYTFDKDALFAKINLSGDELEMYYVVHKALAEKIPVPDLTIYLSASIDIVMQRIAMRDRSYERAIERDYIETLIDAYDSRFLNINDEREVLVLDTNELDFVHQPQDLQWVDNRIRQALQLPPFQPGLPLK
ncbi:MAG TPA: deoxynucleoside kinase [Anaerolineae bacterium]|nr:deoxynucleoside kinase [Anaerolineae bacterium]